MFKREPSVQYVKVRLKNVCSCICFEMTPYNCSVVCVRSYVYFECVVCWYLGICLFFWVLYNCIEIMSSSIDVCDGCTI